MTVTPIPTAASPAGAGMVEPDWSALFTAPAEIARAAGVWSTARDELEVAGTLAPGCGELLRRYAISAVLYDRAVLEVVVVGSVIDRTAGQLPAWNLWHSVMEKAAQAMDTAESELGLTPRRRGGVTKATRRKSGPGTAADKFLGEKVARGG